jgi:prophage DNA circulation protein
MAWQDRLKPATIITPDGVSYPFLYEDVEIVVSNKTSTYTFADTDNALVQNFGLGITSVPLTIFFSGDDYDKEADKFLKAASLPGNSTLEHPIYGTRTVVIESIRRRDALKTAGNQAAFTLIITETIIDEAPTSVEESASVADAEVDDLAETVGEAAESGGYFTQIAADLAAAASRVTAFINKVKEVFAKIVATIAEVEAAFNAIVTAIESSIDFLLGAPLALFGAIQRLLKLPARAIARIRAKIDGYKELFDLFAGKSVVGTTQDAKNQRIESQSIQAAILGGMSSSLLFAATTSTGSAQTSSGENATSAAIAVESGVGGATGTDTVGTVTDAVAEAANSGVGFVTKSDAILFAADLITDLQIAQETMDQEQITSQNSPLETRYVVDRNVTQALSALIKLVAGSLIALSFQLRQERIIELLNDSNLLNLCRSIYGSTQNNTLDFFIFTNSIQDDEFINLPKGREIRYYV